MKQKLENIFNALATCVLIVFFGFCIWGLYIFFTYEDLADVYWRDCVELATKDGYPEDYAHKYCSGPAAGCEKRVYGENCNPEVFCCFKTIEEDKKWNYLDYDEKGNKIKE